MTQEKHVHIHLHLDGLLDSETPSVRPVTQKKRHSAKLPSASVVRKWAIENNVPVSKTGKVGRSTFEAYALQNQ